MSVKNTSPGRDRSFDGKKLALLHDLRKVLIIVVLILLVFHAIFGFSSVTGISMNNTFHDGQLVFYTRIRTAVHRGDVVSVRLPSGEYYIKRVVAVAGDVVDLQDGQLYINGQPESGTYFIGPTKPEEGIVTYPYTIAEGNVFVLGDNRPDSVDSRSFGAVNVLQVQGVIRFALP